MKIIACIPARLKSSRLPNKPLLKIRNKTIIELVYDNVKKVKLIDEIIILTDNIIIKNEVDKFIYQTNKNNNCFIIDEDCLNGTERIILYLKKYTNYQDDTIIVNVQGDEPFINPLNINMAIQNYLNKIKTVNNLVCSTIFYKTNNIIDIDNKNRGKLVLDKYNNIMYCSRNIIPSNKKNKIIPDHLYNIHIGIFVFKLNYLLNEFYQINTPLQILEDIEWLKIIEQGYKINAIEVKEHEIGIDTKEDYTYLKNKYEK